MSFDNRIRASLSRAGHTPDDDVVEELAQHARALYERARADGESRDEALRRVDVQVALWAADAGLMTRRTRLAPAVVAPPATGSLWTAGLLSDIRYAGRLLGRQRGFALLVILTMALGIGATTTLFSVTYGVLMKPLPWPDANRIVRLEETRGGNRPRFNSFSNAAYLAWREQPSTLEAIGAWQPRMLTLTGAGEAERIRVTAASASLFEILKPQPILGTIFTAQDETDPVVVLSEGLWRQRFGADPRVLGRAVQLDGRPYTVVGVVPDEAGFPTREVRAWLPFRVNPTTGNFVGMFEAVGRLRPGATPAQAAEEGTARGLANPPGADMDMAIRAIFGDAGPIRIAATPLQDAMAGDVRGPLLMLLAAVVLLFATATANVASLQLARSTTRRREMAIRSALGAGQGRVTRQLMVENLVLGLGGGVAGLALAVVLHRVLPMLLPTDFPRLQDLTLGGPVLAFAVAVTVLGSLAVGLAPALAARRQNLLESLSEDGAAPAGAGWRSRPARGRMTIMAAQVAIACVLLVGASLLGRSFLALVEADRGFDPSSTLTARLQLPGFAFPTERRADIVDAILERLRDIPGVVAASYTDGPPIGVFGGAAFTMDGRQAQAVSRTVIPGYFGAMGIRFVAGRDFTAEDIATQRPVFIVNQSFAREYLGSQPVGQVVRRSLWEGAEHAEIIGVVEDVRHRGVTEPASIEEYQYRRAGERRMSTSPTLIVRTVGDPMSLVPTLRLLAREHDESLVFDSVLTLEDRVMTTIARPRLYAALIAAFAGFALLIAAVGLFGTLSYSVAQRSRELAVRSALGAGPAQLVALVLRQGLGVVAAGLAIGLAASAALVQFIAAMLYGVTTRDPVTYAAVPAVLLVVALLACLTPALRAARIDPLRVLKSG
jgi:putative ABC transport system permease protein